MDFVDVDDDCKSCASTSTDGHVITNSSDKENCSLLLKPPHRVPSPISDASLGSEDSQSSDPPTQIPPTQQQKPRIWSIVDTATSGGPSSSDAPPRLSPLQRAAYLSPYPKPPASWYTSALGNLSVVTSVGANFPLSAVYSCPTMAPSIAAESSAVSSLNRLRTAAAAFPTAATPGELSLHKAAVAAAAGASPSPPSMFSLATSKALEQRTTPTSSSSAAAIAAMASSSVINGGPSAGRVIS